MDGLTGLDISAGYWLQQFFNGLVLASFYVTLATAYALLQGITNKIVLSFGDFATYGAFAAVYGSLWTMLGGHASTAVVVVALVAALLTAGVLGIAAHALVFAPIARAPGQAVMIASIGLSILLQETMRLQSDARDQWLPLLFPGKALVFGSGGFPAQFGVMQMISVAIGLAATALVLDTMRWSRAGRLWRACAQNARLAELSGVDTPQVLRWSFASAGALAGISGAIIALAYGGVSFHMGLVLGFKAMFAAVIGGFGTVGGAVAGGILLATLEVTWSAAFPLAYRDVAVFAIVVTILVLKPEGLVATKLRRESE
jgi:branched-chain amino acid transport system permease protein